MIIEEYLVAIGAVVDKTASREIKKLTFELNAAAKSAMVLTGTLAAVAAGISAFVVSTAKGIESTALTADVLGMATDELDRWNKASNLATGRTQGMSAEFQTLSRHISEAGRGIGTGIKAFGLLSGQGFPGIWDGGAGRLRDTKDVLLDVADALSRITDPARRIELAEMLGLEKILPFLMHGRKGLEDYLATIDQLGAATQEEAKISRELMLSWREVGLVGKDFSRVMVTAIGPFLRDAMKGFTKWYKANRDILRAKLIPVLSVLGKMIKAMINLVSGLVMVLAKIPTNALIGFLVAASSLMAASILVSLVKIVSSLWELLKVVGLLKVGAFGELLLVAALLALIALSIEDVIVGMKGGKSLFAEWTESCKGLNWQLETTSIMLMLLIDNLKAYLTVLTQPWKAPEVFKETMKNWSTSRDMMMKQFGMQGFEDQINKSPVDRTPSKTMKERLNDLGAAVFSTINNLGGATKSQLSALGQSVSAAGETTLAGANALGGSVNNTFNITMNGVNDPQTFAGKIKKFFEDEVTKVQNNFTGGPVK